MNRRVPGRGFGSGGTVAAPGYRAGAGRSHCRCSETRAGEPRRAGAGTHVVGLDVVDALGRAPVARRPR
jgi:hypothetical protein